MPTKPRNISTSSTWQRAVSLYQDRNFDEALRTFAKVPQKDSQYAEAQFYRALSALYVYPPRYSEAERLFQQVGEQYVWFREQSDWYLALITYQKGDVPRSKHLLTTIAANSAHYQQKSAQELLDRMK